MRFYRRRIDRNYLPYKTYREWTREDFRRCCAYCFRHEEELGGDGHCELDHFVPKHIDPARQNDFYNLYWCCRECNGRANKGTNWPSPEEQARGEVFCDPCDHDPEGVDYARCADGSLDPITPAGRYTIRVLRLNERPSLRVCFRQRQCIRAVYRNNLVVVEELIAEAETMEEFRSRSELGLLLEEMRAIAATVRRFVETEPFVLASVPEFGDFDALYAAVRGSARKADT